MTRYKVTTVPPPTVPEAKDEPLQLDFDVQKLLDKSGAILDREIRNIMFESSKGKLSAASARDLVAYIRLLEDLKKEKQAELENLTDEELDAISRR